MIIIALPYNNVKMNVPTQVQRVLDMNRKIETKVGNNIRRLREAKGMTQEMLATKLQLMGCDITRSAVAKIEVGQRHLYPDEIILIRKILDTTFDAMLTV